MPIYVGIALGLFGALMQATLLQRVDLVGVHIDLVLLMVTCWAALRGVRDGLVWAAIGGVCLAFFSAEPIGASLVGLMLAAVVAGVIGSRVRGARTPLALVGLPPAVLLYYVAVLALMVLFGGTVGVLSLLTSAVAPAFVVDMVIAPLVFVLLTSLSRAITPSPWVGG